jgi:hypothetical protein
MLTMLVQYKAMTIKAMTIHKHKITYHNGPKNGLSQHFATFMVKGEATPLKLIACPKFVALPRLHLHCALDVCQNMQGSRSVVSQVTASWRQQNAY